MSYRLVFMRKVFTTLSTLIFLITYNSITLAKDTSKQIPGTIKLDNSTTPSSLVRLKSKTIILDYIEKKKETTTRTKPAPKKKCRGGGLIGAINCKVTKPIADAGSTGTTETITVEKTYTAKITLKVSPLIRNKAKPCEGKFVAAARVKSASYSISEKIDEATRTKIIAEAKQFIAQINSWNKDLSPADIAAFKKDRKLTVKMASPYTSLSILKGKASPFVFRWKKTYQQRFSLDGFCAILKGPDNVLWNSTTPYTLVLLKDGKPASWAPTVTWRIKKYKSFGAKAIHWTQKTVNGSKNNSLKTPEMLSTFTRKTVILYAKGSGSSVGGVNVTRSATLRLTISNMASSCAALKAKVVAAQQTVSDIKSKIATAKSKLRALKDPAAISGDKITALGTELKNKQTEKDKLEKATQKLAELVKELQTELANLNSLRGKLWRSMSKKARIVSGSYRYKQSQKTPKDKLDFIWAVLGRKDGVPRRTTDPDLDASFAIAEKKAKDLKFQIAGFGLANIAGIATLPLPHPGGKFSILFDGMKFVFDAKIDSTLNLSSFKSSLNLSTKTLGKVGATGNQVRTLANRIKTLQANGKPIQKLTVQLHRLVIKMHGETLDAINALKPTLDKFKSLHSKSQAKLRTLKSSITKIQSDLTKLKKEKEDRAYDKLGVNNKRADLTETITQLNNDLIKATQNFTDMQKRYHDKCKIK